MDLELIIGSGLPGQVGVEKNFVKGYNVAEYRLEIAAGI
jgi:hypothetical protein